jgi:two-component system cell cycle response regulator
MTDYYPTPKNPGHILAVDDLPQNLVLLERELRISPFIITLARSAEEALELCNRQRFEGILMDVSLPVMDGIEACRRLRRCPLNADTPLIFISAVRIGMDWITAGIEAGGIDYLVKPYEASELKAKLAMLVRLSRHHKAALEGERHRTLLEVAGGTAHELAQPLATAQLLIDQLINIPTTPTKAQLRKLRKCLANTNRILNQIQNLHRYITKPYASGRILDLSESSKPLPSPFSEVPPNLPDKD